MTSLFINGLKTRAPTWLIQAVTSAMKWPLDSSAPTHVIQMLVRVTLQAVFDLVGQFRRPEHSWVLST